MIQKKICVTKTQASAARSASGRSADCYEKIQEIPKDMPHTRVSILSLLPYPNTLKFCCGFLVAET